MSRYLALDIGKRRIGIALSDALNITAQGFDVIIQDNQEETLGTIKSLVDRYAISKIIIGMPLNMDGTKGESARFAEGFADILKRELSVDIEMIDERLTTVQGERLLLDAGLSRKKRRASIDKIAAQLILQTYLDLNA